MLAPGGAQVQTLRTMKALAQIGVEVDHFEWWNERQTCDLLHQIGAMPGPLIGLAQAKGWKVANTVLFSETCNRSQWSLLWRKICIWPTLNLPLPTGLKASLPWHAYHLPDQMIVGLQAERNLLQNVYGVAAKNVSIVPLGLTETFLKAGPALRTEEHLICTGGINEAKNSLELARLAAAAKVPILFVGRPGNPGSRYWQEFRAAIDGKYVQHQDYVASEAAIADLLRRARGFVLMSRFENWCLAAHEAAACGLPLLLPDLPWSRERFGNQATYWPRRRNKSAATAALQSFWEQCPKLSPPKIQLYSWTDVAESLRSVYSRMLS
jgi:glycosyltransferase involved in cell wall biosynthesis